MYLVLEKMGKINLFEKRCLRKGKFMKKIKKLFICALMICVLFGCSKAIPFEKKLAGQYNLSGESDYGTVTWGYCFKEDGTIDATVTMQGVSKKSSGTWKKVDDKTISASVSGSNITFTYTETDDSITLNYKGFDLVKE